VKKINLYIGLLVPFFLHANLQRTRVSSILPAGIVTTMGISSSKINSTNTTAGYIINKSGYYYLSNDIEYGPTTDSIPCIKITANDVILDLGTKTIAKNSTSNKKTIGIEIVAGKRNVTIKNGTIRGMGSSSIKLSGISGSSVSDVTIDGILVTGSNTLQPVLDINYSNQVLIKDSFFNNHTDANASPVASSSVLSFINSYGVYFVNSQVSGSSNFTNLIFLSACSGFSFDVARVSNNTSSGNVRAINLTASSDCIFNDTRILNNESQIDFYGFYLQSSSNNNVFNSCDVKGNSALKNLSAYSISSSSVNKFVKCEASGNNNSSTQVSDCNVFGFRLDQSNANTFDSCAARQNSGRVNDGTVSGFDLSSSNSNKIKSCISLGQLGLVATATTAGFVARSGSWNSFVDCEATYNRNENTDNNAAYSRIGAGAIFEGEHGSSMLNCKCGGNASKEYSYGICLCNGTSRVCEHCSIATSEFFSNNSLGSNSGYSFGIYDGSLDSTAFIKANIAFGHGYVFDGTSVKDPSEADMNFFIQYQEQYETMNLANIIKEADISNFNIIAEAGGKDLFNWSIVSNANSGQSD
jgi:hypothetical protein